MHLRFGGLLHGGAYTQRGLFSEFYCISPPNCNKMLIFCKQEFFIIL